ncbi:tRNA lysidine(34) synthetase TilS [Ruania albidiflava]|uniref:tRNA lysidine(34) synthetase TilS n=1 Tax=Ruania albidiflava TaxID=366586 RepID=UPI000480814F|nr:tRNA lysidine(34) synthetase TilS [Ruania albidiflava]
MAGPPVPVAQLRHAVRTFLTDRIRDGQAAPGDLVLIACSGGADSLALAAAAAFATPKVGLRAGAVVVDHRLQPGSTAAAERAAAVCTELGLMPSIVVPATLDSAAAPESDSAQGGPEARARALRYHALEATRQQQRACAVLLGHTRDDQAETVLLALARGSGTRALAGMAPVRERWWRPLLGSTRADTEGVCTALGLPVWYDPTNAVDGPWQKAAGGPLPRAALRHRVLPALTEALGPGVPAALARTAQLARDDADLLDVLADELRQRAQVVHGPDQVQLSITALTDQPPALRRRVLHQAALTAGSPPGALAAVHVCSLDQLVTDWRGQGPIHLPGALEAVREYGRLVLRAAPSARTGGGRPDPTVEQEK